MSAKRIDRTAAKATLARELTGGTKLSTVAAQLDITEGHASHLAAEAGICHVWTTEQERRILAALRSGQLLISAAVHSGS